MKEAFRAFVSKCSARGKNSSNVVKKSGEKNVTIHGGRAMNLTKHARARHMLIFRNTSNIKTLVHTRITYLKCGSKIIIINHEPNFDILGSFSGKQRYSLPADSLSLRKAKGMVVGSILKIGEIVKNLATRINPAIVEKNFQPVPGGNVLQATKRSDPKSTNTVTFHNEASLKKGKGNSSNHYAIHHPRTWKGPASRQQELLSLSFPNIIEKLEGNKMKSKKHIPNKKKQFLNYKREMMDLAKFSALIISFASKLLKEVCFTEETSAPPKDLDENQLHTKMTNLLASKLSPEDRETIIRLVISSITQYGMNISAECVFFNLVFQALKSCPEFESLDWNMVNTKVIPAITISYKILVGKYGSTDSPSES